MSEIDVVQYTQKVVRERQSQINDILKSNNLPALVFTHPKDPYDGLLSDWVEDIPGVERIIISIL